MTALLELRGVYKTYFSGHQPYHAVKDVNLQICQGDYTAIMGPSGSGKSTLMHLLGLLDEPTAGDVLIEGKPIRNLSETDWAHLRNQRIGFVFQAFYLLPRTSVLENILLPTMYSRGASRPGPREAMQALRRVGLSERIARLHPNQLSGGQQQRVAIARALINNPAIILADEPTGNLDSHATKEILGVFQSLHDEGTTIVLVTHDPDVAHHADRVLHVLDGRIHHEERVLSPTRIHFETGVTP
ncbi:MAG: ABC transporter ATP-binding protein [Alicyclobacillus sp.]|nr:ABC transporter ATP-binding protein [Alicyclobacillus sp.]